MYDVCIMYMYMYIIDRFLFKFYFVLFCVHKWWIYYNCYHSLNIKLPFFMTKKKLHVTPHFFFLPIRYNIRCLISKTFKTCWIIIIFYHANLHKMCIKWIISRIRKKMYVLFLVFIIKISLLLQAIWITFIHLYIEIAEAGIYRYRQ